MTTYALNKWLLTIVMLLTLVFSGGSFASPTANLKKVGQGTMSWFFMDIYQATLWSGDGQYSPKQYPQALTIRYQRNISKQALLKATEEQWQHLSFKASLYSNWLQQLAQLWPDIKDGDQLTFLVANNGRGDFYHNEYWLGTIADSALSDAFLSIWLAPNSSEPKLRRKLIGEDK